MDEQKRIENRLRQQRYRELHRAELNDKRRERYEERKASNKCPRCGGKVKKGYTLCPDCCEYQGVLNKRYAEIRKAAAPAKAVKKTVKAAAAKTEKTAAAKKTAVKNIVKAKADKPVKAAKKTVAAAKAVKKTAK